MESDRCEEFDGGKSGRCCSHAALGSLRRNGKFRGVMEPSDASKTQHRLRICQIALLGCGGLGGAGRLVARALRRSLNAGCPSFSGHTSCRKGTR